MSDYEIVCMSFDGDYVRENGSFKTIQEAWDYAGDMGSKWFFYPFIFIVNEDDRVIADAATPLEWTIGMPIGDVKASFSSYSEGVEDKDMGADEYALSLTVYRGSLE